MKEVFPSYPIPGFAGSEDHSRINFLQGFAPHAFSGRTLVPGMPVSTAGRPVPGKPGPASQHPFRHENDNEV